MYKALFIDFDDTLYDFPYQSKNSLKRVLNEQGIFLSEDIYHSYKQFNAEFWRDFEKGVYKDSSLAYTRFQKLKDKYGFSYDAKRVNLQYLTNLYRFLKPIDNSEATVKKLSRKYDIYIITNGLHRAQVPKLNASKIKECVKDVFISEDIGYSKPSEKYFEYCLNSAGLSKNEVLIIGDSLTSDMAGGVNAGIDTCWFNIKQKDNTFNIPITYTVNSMKEIEELLGV